jgi:hypothetical protein
MVPSVSRCGFNSLQRSTCIISKVVGYTEEEEILEAKSVVEGTDFGEW